MKLLKRSAGLVAIMLMSSSLAAQSPAPSLLRIDVTNHTIYVYDTDQSRWATTPRAIASSPRRSAIPRAIA